MPQAPSILPSAYDIDFVLCYPSCGSHILGGPHCVARRLVPWRREPHGSVRRAAQEHVCGTGGLRCGCGVVRRRLAVLCLVQGALPPSFVFYFSLIRILILIIILMLMLMLMLMLFLLFLIFILSLVPPRLCGFVVLARSSISNGEFGNSDDSTGSRDV